MIRSVSVCFGICRVALIAGCGGSTARLSGERQVYVPVNLQCVDDVTERLAEIPEEDRHMARYFPLSRPSETNPNTSGLLELGSAEQDWMALLLRADDLMRDCIRDRVPTAI